MPDHRLTASCVRQATGPTERPTSFRITSWRELPENTTETFGKDTRAIIIGRLAVRA